MIENGWARDTSGHYFADTTVYECSRDYELVGAEFVTCGKTGNWSQPPFCQGK